MSMDRRRFCYLLSAATAAALAEGIPAGTFVSGSHRARSLIRASLWGQRTGGDWEVIHDFGEVNEGDVLEFVAPAEFVYLRPCFTVAGAYAEASCSMGTAVAP